MLLLNTGFSLPAAAQEVANASAEAHSQAVQRQIARHRDVRVHAGGQFFELRNARADAVGIIMVGLQGNEQHIGYASVDWIEYRTSAWRKGLRAGAIGGGLLSLVVGVASAADDYYDFSAGEVVAVTALGAAFYGAIGAAVGAAFKEWRTAYRHPSSTIRTFALRALPGGRLGAGISLQFSVPARAPGN